MYKRSTAGIQLVSFLTAFIALAPFAFGQFASDLDPDFFGGRALVRASGVTVRGIARQADGKIIVAGYFNNGPTNLADFYVARLTADGVPDTTFASPLGWRAISFASGANEFAYAVAVAPDGKIVIAGNVTCANTCSQQVGVARLNPDGSLDTSFSGDGLATVSAGTSSNAAAVAVQSDLKIVVAGSVGGLPSISGTRFSLSRLDANGDLDPTFSGGRVNTEINPGTSPASQAGVNSLAIQGDGRIVAAGYANCPSCPTSSQGFALTRYTTTGALDTTFSTDGKAFINVTDSTDFANSVAVLPNGKIVAAGEGFDLFTSLWSAAIIQFNSDGSLDTGFGTNGVVVDRINPAGQEGAFTVAAQSDNKVVVGGLFTGSPGRFVRRYLVNGMPDNTFDSDGVNSSILFLSNDVADSFFGLFTQPDGKIVAAGTASANITLVRLGTDGTLDGTFGNRVRPYYFEFDDRTDAVAVQSDGKIVMVGSSGSDAVNSRNFVAKRLGPDGILDASFGSNTTAVISRVGNDELARAAKVQPDDKIVIAGSSTGGGGNACAVGRFTAAGVPDGTFGTTGGVAGIRIASIGTGAACSGLAIQPDGKIVVSGTAVMSGNNDFAILRYNSNGVLDTTFDADGIVTTPVGAGFDESFDVAVLPDGKILAAGKSDGFLSFAKYNANGSLDASFGNGGKVITALAVSDADGKISLAVKSNGKIVAGGPAGAAGTHDFGIVRLNPNGSPDATFGTGGIVTTDFGADDVISRIGLQSNDQIVAVGSTNLSGKYDFAAARYNFDGTLDTTFDLANGALDEPTGFKLSIVSAFSNGKIVDWLNGEQARSLSFVGDGKVITSIGALNDRALTMFVQPDDKIIAAGSSETTGGQTHFALTRYRGSPNIGSPVTVTVQTNQTGLSFSVDGTTYTSAQTFKWTTGSNHTISTTSPQSGGGGTPYAWTNWSDGGAISHVVSPASDTTYTANFGIQCSYVLNPTGTNVAATGGNESFSVTAPTGCNWTAVSNSVWVTTSSTGSGNGTVDLAVSVNAGEARTAIVTVGGQEFTVQQSAADAPTDQPILFTTGRDGNNEIYRMNEDGTDQQRLTDTPENEGGGFWSPDGTKILYRKTISSSETQIWTMNPDGSGKTMISDAGELELAINWSPNGQKILFSKRPAAGVEDLWSMNPDGSNKVQLTNAGTVDHFPTWSPDSSKIAFGRCNPQLVCDIFTMNADGSNQTNLTSANPNDDDQPIWTNDGSKLIYGSSSDGSNFNVVIMNSADGTNKTPLTNVAAPLAYVGNKLSPDGSKIGTDFLSTASSSSREVAVVNVDGSGAVNLTNNSVIDIFHNWSPDGEKIIFGSRRDTATAYELYTMNADGSDVARLTFNTANDSVTDWYRPQQPGSAWWKGEGNALDSDGTNHGTLNGNTSFVPGRVGQSFSFDGTGDSVEVPNTPLFSRSANAPLTVTLWAFRADGQDRVHILGKRGACDGNPFNYQMGIHSGIGLNFFFGSSAGYAATSIDVVPVNQWTMLTATFDGTTIRLYKDAQQVAWSTTTLGPENASSFKFGSSGTCDATGDGWRGKLDEIRFFDRALTLSEIEAIYAEAPALPQISGHITKNGQPLAGVTVALTGASTATAITDASGSYWFPNLNAGGDYTITPTLADHAFTPISSAFTNISTNQTADFTAVEGCIYSLSPTSQTIPNSGGNGSFSVTSQPGCTWIAQSSIGWLTTGSTGSGNGTVNFTGDANSGPQRSGTITVAGQIFTVQQESAPVPSSDMELDPQFAAQVADAFGPVFATAVQPDGKILVGGGFTRVSGAVRNGIDRLNADGSRDLTFNPGGTGAPGQTRMIIPLPDGKILAGGSFTAYNGVAVNGRIIRLNSDGSVDSTFNSGGSGANGLVYDAVIQSDSKIVIAGTFTQYNGTAMNRVARLNADGTLDQTFNPGSGPDSTVDEIEILSNGKFVIGGFFANVAGQPRKSIARLNSDGSLDATFDVGSGADIPGNSAGARVEALAVQADGKVIVGGAFSHYNGTAASGLIRLNDNGSPDPTFIPGTGGYFRQLKVLPDGRIYLGGGGGGAPAIQRLLANGTLDASYQPQEVNDVCNDFSVQSDGRLIVGGSFYSVGGTFNHHYIYRSNSDGTVDGGFNAEIGTRGVVNSIRRQPDNKIVVSGNFYTANGTLRTNVARFNDDGTLDTAFDPAITSAFQSVNDTDLQSDGKIIIAGSITTIRVGPNVFPVNAIARLNTDGTYDPGFNSTTPSGSITAVRVVAGDKTVAAGTLTVAGQTRRLVRFNNDGSLDASFVNGDSNGSMLDVEILPDGKMLAAGTFNQYNGNARFGLVRLNSDGSVDTGFNTGSGPNAFVRDVSVLSNGKIIAIGGFTSYNGIARRGIVRLNADGTVDESFVPPDVATGYLAAAVLPSGDLIVSGTFIGYDGGFSNGLVRLNPDGSLDNGFVGKVNVEDGDFVTELLTDDSGRVVAGGQFDAYDGTVRRSLLRLRPTSPAAKAPFDFDGDSQTDIAVYRPSNGQWWLNRSSTSLIVYTFGSGSDLLAPADFTGDGKTDVAIWRPATGEWFILRSEDATFYSFPFGASSDQPVPNDYDGDGIADPAVYRAATGTWYIQNSGGGTTIQGFGLPEDHAVPADYDGDGRADLAIYRPSLGQWWINRSTAGVIAYTFGSSTDKNVQGDYTGDGKADVAIFRPATGEWYILRSEDSTFYSFPFGVSTDVPVPGDYDGDGKFDAAVFRPSDATWYIQRSTAGMLIQGFGLSADRPVPNAFIR